MKNSIVLLLLLPVSVLQACWPWCSKKLVILPTEQSKLRLLTATFAGDAMVARKMYKRDICDLPDATLRRMQFQLCLAIEGVERIPERTAFELKVISEFTDYWNLVRETRDSLKSSRE